MRFRLSKIIQQTSNYNYQFTFRPRLIVLVALYQTIKRQMRHKAIYKSRLCNWNKYTKYGMFTKIHCMFCTCRIHKQTRRTMVRLLVPSPRIEPREECRLVYLWFYIAAFSFAAISFSCLVGY